MRPPRQAAARSRDDTPAAPPNTTRPSRRHGHVIILHQPDDVRFIVLLWTLLAITHSIFVVAVACVPLYDNGHCDRLLRREKWGIWIWCCKTGPGLFLRARHTFVYRRVLLLLAERAPADGCLQYRLWNTKWRCVNNCGKYTIHCCWLLRCWSGDTPTRLCPTPGDMRSYAGTRVNLNSTKW